MLCVALPSFAVKPPKENERWISVGAGNVAVYSNATDEEARAVAAEVLRVREAVVAISRLDGASLLPVKVYIFRDAAAFAAYRKALLPRKNGAAAAGYSLATPEVILLVLQAGGRIDRALAEEVADQFLAGPSAKPARWSSDLFAESLATSARDEHLAKVGKPVELARDEVLYQLGFLLGRGDPSLERRDAETFLSEVVRLNPKHSAAYDDLGLHYFISNRYAEADVAFNRAIALGSTNPNLYVRYGLMLLDQLETRRPAGQTPSPEVITKMRELFGKAAELDPANAFAHMGLGASYLYTRDNAPGIAELEKSVQLAPGNDHARFILMQLYARAGRREDTQRTAALVMAHTTDAARLQSVRESLLDADFIYASNLVLEDKLTGDKLNEVTTLLRHVDAQTNDPEKKAHARQLLRMLNVLQVKSQTAELKAILDLAKSGKVKEALAQMDALMPQLEHEVLLKAARKLRADLARAGQ
jgi:Flp pilus assembly protein TadD